jgi:hypothetical protein
MQEEWRVLRRDSEGNDYYSEESDYSDDYSDDGVYYNRDFRYNPDYSSDNFGYSKKPLTTLKKKINEAYKKDFKWQETCSKLNKEGKEYLEEVAYEFGLEYNTQSSKRELCKIISENVMEPLDECEDSNLFGDDLNKLPRWRIIKIKSSHGVKCYDIVDMKKIIESGETRNPYTREELDVRAIQNRIIFLKYFTTKDVFSGDLFTEVRNNPIFSKEEYLNNIIIKLYALFPYMLSPNLITMATDDEVYDMIMYIFDNPTTKSFEGFSRGDINRMTDSTGIQKKILFIETILRLLEGDSDVKTNYIYTAFLFFEKRKRGEDVSDDTFLFSIS